LLETEFAAQLDATRVWKKHLGFDAVWYQLDLVRIETDRDEVVAVSRRIHEQPVSAAIQKLLQPSRQTNQQRALQHVELNRKLGPEIANLEQKRPPSNCRDNPRREGLKNRRRCSHHDVNSPGGKPGANRADHETQKRQQPPGKASMKRRVLVASNYSE